MNILIAPDSFKGSLSAKEVADAMEKGMRKVLKNSIIKKVPMADGGEGTVETLVAATGGRIIKTKARGPLYREIDSFFGILGDADTAVIEIAAVSGLSLLEEKERNPLITTTFGVGQLIKKALHRGVKRIVVGIGDSATVDGGAGMAQALGAKLLDKNGRQIPIGGGNLKELRNIELDKFYSGIENTEFLVASDVDNPLTGKKGAARVYGPQKGATPDMVKELEENLCHYGNILKKKFKKQVAKIPGAGAAGGLGAGLIAFCKADLRPGIEIVAELFGLPDLIKDIDLIVTGEGQIDKQTLYGKTLCGIGRLAKSNNIPVIAINGAIGEGAFKVHECGIDAYFSSIRSSQSDFKKEAESMLVENVEQLARLMKISMDKLGKW